MATSQSGNQENIALETDSGNSTVAAYTLAPQGYGNLVSQRRSGASSFHHYDALGSTDRLTDSSQNALIAYLYRAFGQQSVLSGSHANRMTWGGRRGYYRQPDPANYWLRARIYRDLAGRFLTQDPIRAGVNPFRWPGNNPVMLLDPSGRQGCCAQPGHACHATTPGGGAGRVWPMGSPGDGFGAGFGSTIGWPTLRRPCPGRENTCCEVPRPGMGWWTNPQGIRHENWEEVLCSCGPTLPNCLVDFFKKVYPPGKKPVTEKMTRLGRCVACERRGRGRNGPDSSCAPYITRAGLLVSCVKRCALAATRAVSVPYFNELGQVQTQTIRVHKAYEAAVQNAFAQVALDFMNGVTSYVRPIRHDWPIWHWDWRFANGGAAPERVSQERCYDLSYHAHGLAIDVNAPANDRHRPNPNWQSVEYCPYAWRDADALVQALESVQWDWGGHFSDVDYMHFGAGEDGTSSSGFTSAVCE